MFRKMLVAAAIAASLGTIAAPDVAAVDVYVHTAPPPPRVEHVPPPRKGYVWADGHWEWHGSKHVWVKGTWIKERPGYRYHSPHWVEDKGRWRMEKGAWSPNDHDGDGVPNKYDKQPENPNRK